MLSGTLTPSSANLVPRTKYLTEGDCNEVNERTKNNNDKTKTETCSRSAALERAYVHDVYENCVDSTGPIRPRVAQFLAGLDTGSLVCDVGCGNGRYLNSCNPFIYTMGVDRCYRFAKAAAEKGGEVTVCDNLVLPFKDESFDAVLSLAVIHHFATTDRRVGAIQELARILRIGGRVIITVWAFEQRHRRFESQDVLIPWQPPKVRNNNTSDDEDDDEYLPPYHAYTEDSTNSSRSAGDGDSSSLSSSSPGDSCYSFVRRAIQKLAGGKRHPWFLDSWNSRDTKNDSSLDYEDAKDLPIELRRLEDFEDLPEPPISASLKSRSLGSILNPPPRQIVRSRSSVPSLGIQSNETSSINAQMPEHGHCRPKLIKQKQSLCDDDTDLGTISYRNIINYEDDNRKKTEQLRKQSSLNEELMAANRIREKERVRKRIQKQMSLNEAFLCRSLFTKRRLQVIREGFTSKIKTSTGSLERVTKNGFVKIMQNFTGVQSTPFQEPPHTNNIIEETVDSKISTLEEPDSLRRYSRESGSDSSKDSSLQSDTSVESEDSFASVIYIPRPNQVSTSINSPINQTNTLSNGGLQTSTKSTMRMHSVPNSPSFRTCPTPNHSPAQLNYPQSITCRKQHSMDETRFSFEVSQNQKSEDKFYVNQMNDLKTIEANTKNQLKPDLVTTTKRITKDIIKDLPPIPKFKRVGNYPIVRRSSASPAVPKLKSLEIFNPEIDDVDSDSSEPSSPDSIDSVINALEATRVQSKTDEKTQQRNTDEQSLSNDINELHLLDFANKVSVQLLKELDEKKMDGDKGSNYDKSDLNVDRLTDFKFDLYSKRINGDNRDLSTLREELRERRLMLANLNIHQYSSSNTASSVIHEEDESPKEHAKSDEEVVDDNTDNDYEAHDMALLISGDEDSSPEEQLPFDNDIDSGTSTKSLTNTNYSLDENIGDTNLKNSTSLSFNRSYYKTLTRNNNESPHQSVSGKECLLATVSPTSSVASTTTAKSIVTNEPDNMNICNNNNTGNGATIESRQSVESWGHSNSTGSLDSPSTGGSATHHRFYHVFREGELDSLINHHVTSLHIVSSYYERASWCVVAEKVQVWTI